MAKKKDEKDVLVVRDEKTGEISVVAGLNADGTPKRTPAKAENAQSFLQFDRHGDVLDNFFKNFFRQCKEPRDRKSTRLNSIHKVQSRMPSSA